jgi:hypothetical protein
VFDDAPKAMHLVTHHHRLLHHSSECWNWNLMS